MLILGIESSCDETAAAIVRDGRQVLSSAVSSQILVHQKYGGVVPELASREHLRAIVPVVDEALSVAGVTLSHLSAIAVTQGPGLVGSLLVGITFAKSLALAQGLPLIAVHHLDGHIHAVLLEHPEAALPALALVVSGGHTHLFLCHADRTYKLLAKTRDDAAGEAFDKVAKLLGFGYPGGPIIDDLAPHGNPHAIRFTSSKMKGNTLDFSFSGIKTAVLRYTEANPQPEEVAARRELLRTNPKPTTQEWLAVTSPATLDLVASFQYAVVRELLSRIRTLVTSPESPIAEEHVASVIVTGGVACNRALRAGAQEMRLGTPIFFPTPKLSTDNAAMIAAAAFPRLDRAEVADMSLKARANFSLQI